MRYLGLGLFCFLVGCSEGGGLSDSGSEFDTGRDFGADQGVADRGMADVPEADGGVDSGAFDATADDLGLDAGLVDASTSTHTGLNLNDVSVLWPLPQAGDLRSDFLWVTPGTGESGPYFPVHRRDELPVPIADFPIQPGATEMVVALRFDPCARADEMSPCEAQLRLVAQPVIFTGPDDAQMLDDSAMHLFYTLNQQDAANVEAELRRLSDSSTISTAGPLGVHPVLQAQGAGGGFGSALRGLVVTNCRADNLKQITTNTFAFDNWAFSRHDWANDHFTRRPLVGMTTQSETQAWLRQASRDDLNDPAGLIDPPSVNSFAYLLSRDVYTNPDPVQRDVALAIMAFLQNPQRTIVDTSDCVSCHVGAQLALYAERQGLDFSQVPEVYAPPSTLDTRLIIAPSIQGNLGNTIMFGYHQGRAGPPVPSISQRVINETAEALVYLGDH